jgi:hypothetical protein
MPLGLERFQHSGDFHFVTFSCYGKEPYLIERSAKETFEWKWSSYQYYATGVSGTVKIAPGYVTPP